ncbi:MAG: hypothetical protein JW829_01175 [Pirellulales bacterium]|nr:hypothetical protein [Pirellulales bacterium]
MANIYSSLKHYLKTFAQRKNPHFEIELVCYRAPAGRPGSFVAQRSIEVKPLVFFKPSILVGILVSCLFLGTTRDALSDDFASVGLYQSFDELVTWAHAFETTNSDLVNLVEFGRSYQDRPLLALQISVQPGINDPTKPEFLFTAGLHAREVIGSQAAFQLAEHLVDGYRNGDPATMDSLAEREVWIVPNLNPDGRIRVEEGYSRQRKTMELFPGQNPNNYTRGVDLNRNFPHRWDQALSTVTDETYRGPSVLSTPEASSLWSILQDNDYFNDLWAAIDIHSGAETILAPWTSPTEFRDYPLPPEDRAKFDFLADTMSQLTGLSTDRLSYDSYGVLADSLYETFGAYAFVEEIFTGPWYYPYDYFKYFNPINQFGIDESVNDAIASAMFLISDDAFLIAIPEPSSLVILSLMGFLFILRLLEPGKDQGMSRAEARRRRG